MLVLGVGQAARQSLGPVLIQSNVSDAFRGRISSLMLLEDGVESSGIFGIAMLADVIGPEYALAATGVALLGMAAYLWSVPRIRRIE